MTDSQKNIPFISTSVFLHALLLLLVFYFESIRSFFGFESPLEVIELKRVIQVDVVEMPKMSLQELKSLPAINEPDAVEKAEVAVKEDEPVIIKKINLFDRLKDLAKKDVEKKPKRKVETQKKPSKEELARVKELKNLVLSGNQVVKGTLSFDDTTSSGEELNSYLSLMIEQIRTQWKLPGYLMDQNLKCRIRVYINAKGAVLRTEVVESSGNEDYDQRAISSIHKTSPFGEVPQDIRDSLSDGKIVLGFPI